MSALWKRDRRALGLGLTLATVLTGGLLMRPADTPPESPTDSPAAQVPESQQAFDLAVGQLRARRYGAAAVTLDRVLALSPRMPEAHVNKGFALMGLSRVAEVRAAFERAIEIRPGQANAYYGLALTFEADGDLSLATGAMRSYLHLARGERPEHLSRARAALWEWEQAAAKR